MKTLNLFLFAGLEFHVFITEMKLECLVETIPTIDA